MVRTALATLGIVAQVSGMAQTGFLDPSFGSDGIFTFAPGSLHDVAYGMAVLPDDQLVFCGSGRVTSTTGFTSDCVVGRLTADGALDPTFGFGGTYVLSSEGGSVFGYELKLQPDGKIVVCGGYSQTPSNTDFMVIRLMPDGTLDLSFGGGDGVALIPVGEGEDYAYDLEVLEDGRLLLAGTSAMANGMYDQGIMMRLLSDGSLDPSFGTNGMSSVQISPTSSDSFRSLVLHPTGRIVAAGYSYANFTETLLLAAFTPDGFLDPGFGAGGIHSGTSISEAFDAVASPERIYVGGRLVTDGYDLGVSCFDWNGQLDPAFGNGGAVTANYNPIDFILGMQLQEDGKLLCVGATGLGTFNNRDIIVTRYLPDGTLDESFAGTGYNIIPVSSSFEDGSTVLQQSDGKIVVAGFAAFTNNDMVFLRLLNDPSSNLTSFELDDRLLLYPIPLDGGVLNIQLPMASSSPVVCKLLDASFRLVSSETFPGGTASLALPLPSNLPGGTYLVTLDTDGSHLHRVVIK
jgi:uncharacterized delta-60 repeat protein